MTPSGSTTPKAAATPEPFTDGAGADARAGRLGPPQEADFPKPKIGDTVLVRMDPTGIERPLLITWAGMVPIYDRLTPTVDNPLNDPIKQQFRVSGVLFCEPDDHRLDIFRGALDRPHEPAKIATRPDRLFPMCYAESLAPGSRVGDWRRK